MTPRDWNEMKKLLGDRADQETLEAVKALVEGIETNLSGSLTANVVKSIQRGNFSITIKAGSTVDVTIAEVDPTKCEVSVIGAESDARVKNFTSTKLTLESAHGSSSATTSYLGTYQIVEYY